MDYADFKRNDFSLKKTLKKGFWSRPQKSRSSSKSRAKKTGEKHAGPLRPSYPGIPGRSPEAEYRPNRSANDIFSPPVPPARN